MMARLRVPRFVRIPAAIETVPSGASDELVRRQLEASAVMLAERTRADVRPLTSEAHKLEQAVEHFPRRDGVITQPLAHHRFPWKRSKFDHFKPRPRPTTDGR